MAYQLKPGENVADGVHRIANEELVRAVSHLVTLRSAPAKGGTEIHEARKSAKKTRALLRLVKSGLPKGYFRIENRRLRDAGRKLSHARDAQANLDTLDDLAAKNPELDFRWIRRMLERARRGASTASNSEDVALASNLLTEANHNFAHWHLAEDGFDAIETDLKKCYRSARKLAGNMEKSDSADAFHSFRKQVKLHWYHLRLLEASWTDETKAYAASVKKLESSLGDDHNLAVLSANLLADAGASDELERAKPFLDLFSAASLELRVEALKLAESVYEKKPGAYVRGLKESWEAWKSPAPEKKRPARALASRAAAAR